MEALTSWQPNTEPLQLTELSHQLDREDRISRALFRLCLVDYGEVAEFLDDLTVDELSGFVGDSLASLASMGVKLEARGYIESHLEYMTRLGEGLTAAFENAADENSKAVWTVTNYVPNRYALLVRPARTGWLLWNFMDEY